MNVQQRFDHVLHSTSECFECLTTHACERNLRWRDVLRESSRLALVDLLRLDARADVRQLSECWQNRPPSFQAGRVQLKLGLPASLVEPTRAGTR